jgi:multidrug efflux system outer membrane protein
MYQATTILGLRQNRREVVHEQHLVEAKAVGHAAPPGIVAYPAPHPNDGLHGGTKVCSPAGSCPPVYRGADEAPVSSADQDSLGDQKWAQVFRAPELQDLIRAALENNYDVRIAAQRVLEAQAQLRIARSQQFPIVSIGGTGIGADIGDSVGNGLPNGGIAAGFFNLSAAWTPDFWAFIAARLRHRERKHLVRSGRSALCG